MKRTFRVKYHHNLAEHSKSPIRDSQALHIYLMKGS